MHSASMRAPPSSIESPTSWEAAHDELAALIVREARPHDARCTHGGTRGNRLLPLLRRARPRTDADRSRYPARQASRTNCVLRAAAFSSASARGIFLWRYFGGQIAAALVAGNSVVAKPAEQTPLIAFRAVQLMFDAGVPRDVLQLVLGRGETVGKALTSDPRVAGVAFTGSTATARAINRALAARDSPIGVLIAETGGQNAMIVDSSALPEQVTDAVV